MTRLGLEDERNPYSRRGDTLEGGSGDVGVTRFGKAGDEVRAGGNQLMMGRDG
jgi:hypothetical protein